MGKRKFLRRILSSKIMRRLKKKAVVLLSGGLDSAVTLYSAKKEGYECHCLTFDYGQRHKTEIARAMSIAAKAPMASTITRAAAMTVL